MTKTENRNVGLASLWRQWPGSIVLLGLGLIPAGEASCFAADPAPAQAPVPTVPVAPALGSDVIITDDAPAPAAPQKAEPARTKPATKKGALLGAIDDALNDDRPAPVQKAEPEGAVLDLEIDALDIEVAAPQQVKPAKAAAKKGSLLGAIVEAINDEHDDPNVRNMEAQLQPQFQQLLYVELAFMRRACKPDAKSFAEVARAAQVDLRVPLHEYVSSWYGARRQAYTGSIAADPRAGMQKLLMPLVKAKLGPDKAQVYGQECDKRTEARKHAVVLSLVAGLDERLVLTAQQRAKLVQSLSANYESPWGQFFEAYGYSGQNVPSIRDESIVPLLDEKQKRVWGETTKLNGQMFFGQVFQNILGGETMEIQEIAGIIEEAKNDK